MKALASLHAVHKAYGQVTALRDVSLSVEAGEAVAFLGPNGAGKTTAISLLAGTRRPDTGRVELFGGDPREPASRLRVGATPQETRFPATLKVREIVDLVAIHYPDRMSVDEAAEAFGLSDFVERQAGGLSGGQQRRLSVALAFVGRPDLVFLDEPTTGLDVTSRRQLWSHIRRYHDDGGAILLTTHYLEEAEALADRIVLIDRGEVLVEGTVEEIRERLGLKRVDLTTPAPSTLPETPAAVAGDRVTLYVSDSDAFVRALVASGVPFDDLEIRPVSLEEAFIALTAP